MRAVQKNARAGTNATGWIWSACLVLSLPIFASCSYSYKITSSPADAVILVNGAAIVSGEEYSTGEPQITVSAKAEGCLDLASTFTLDLFSVREIPITLEKKIFAVSIRAVPENLMVSVDSGTAAPSPYETTLSFGDHAITLSDKGNPVFETSVFIMADTVIPVRAPGRSQAIYPLLDSSLARSCGLFPTGSQPKQVIFTRDSRFLYIPLLDDVGFDIFSMDSFRREQVVRAGTTPEAIGFPEGLFIDAKNRFLVTQMTRNKIIEYDCSDFAAPKLLREFGSGGVMPKIVVYSDELDLLAVSNWESNSVVLIDYATGTVRNTIKGIPVPRGLLFSPDSKKIYIASYEGGLFLEYSTATWQELRRLSVPDAAMRHIVMTKNGATLFVSDMYHFRIYEIDCASFSIVHTYPVYHNPNTIDLTPDDGILFVSCRGPNNPGGYLLPSLINGKVLAFDVRRRVLLGAIDGGRQPTGLDVSPDGKYLAFSNFQDQSIEIYNIEKIWK